MRYAFDVPGEPRGKGRPRAAVFAGHAKVYTPEATASYENRVALAFRQAYPLAEPSRRPLAVTLTFSFPLNKGDYTGKGFLGKHGKAKLSGKERHAKKPDVDNLVKSVLDGLNGIAFMDDSQICCITAAKRYATSPSCRVIICELD